MSTPTRFLSVTYKLMGKDEGMLMKRQFVKSSCLKSVGYDFKSRILEVEFPNGDIYQYHGVSPELYKDLMNVSSLGKFFLSNIKNIYPFKVMDD